MFQKKNHKNRISFPVVNFAGSITINMETDWKPTPLPHDDTCRAGFHVGYRVGESKYGKGLFATHFIPKGTLLWKYRCGPPGSSGVNVWCYSNEAETRQRIGHLTPGEATFFMDHVYAFEGKLNEILDDGKLWNHSENPNTGLPPYNTSEYDVESTYSIQDINEGDEFLDDYGTYAYEEWYNRLLLEFGCNRDFVNNRKSENDGGGISKSYF